MIWIGIFIVIFAGAFLYERNRVPRVEAWFRRNGFERLNSIMLPRQIQLQLRNYVRMFGPLNRSWNFGVVFARSDGFIIAEHDLRRPDGQRYWYTLFSFGESSLALGELRVESVSAGARRYYRGVRILLFPLLFILDLLTPTRKKAPDTLLTPVDFKEDGAFDEAYRVYGDATTAKCVLNSDVRSTLVRLGWEGEIAIGENALVWRRKGLLELHRMSKLLPEIELMKALFLAGQR